MVAPVPQYALVCISVSFLFLSTGNTEPLHLLPLPLIHASFLCVYFGLVLVFLLEIVPEYIITQNAMLPSFKGQTRGRDRRGERDLVTGAFFTCWPRVPCGSWILSQLSSVCTLFLQAPTPSGPWLPHPRPQALRFLGSKVRQEEFVHRFLADWTVRRVERQPAQEKLT